MNKVGSENSDMSNDADWAEPNEKMLKFIYRRWTSGQKTPEIQLLLIKGTNVPLTSEETPRLPPSHQSLQSTCLYGGLYDNSKDPGRVVDKSQLRLPTWHDTHIIMLQRCSADPHSHDYAAGFFTSLEAMTDLEMAHWHPRTRRRWMQWIRRFWCSPFKNPRNHKPRPASTLECHERGFCGHLLQIWLASNTVIGTLFYVQNAVRAMTVQLNTSWISESSDTISQPTCPV